MRSIRLFVPCLLLVSVLLSGCGVFRRSPTWAMVMSTRIDTRDAGDPSEAYAEQLSSALKTSGVEHKIVSYEFRYRTPLREEAIATRTAVLYRDNTDTRNPWWLMDDRLRTPVWLPSSDMDNQVSFYLRRPARVVAVNGIPANDFKGGRSLAGSEPVTMLASRTMQPGKPVAFRTTPDRDLERFRRANGSEFDPQSVADRLKMERLLNRGMARVALR